MRGFSSFSWGSLQIDRHIVPHLLGIRCLSPLPSADWPIRDRFSVSPGLRNVSDLLGPYSSVGSGAFTFMVNVCLMGV